MSGRKIWINFEAHQRLILHINPWNKCSDLKLFSKYLKEPSLRPLRLNFEVLNFFSKIKTYSWQPQKCNAEVDPILSSRPHACSICKFKNYFYHVQIFLSMFNIFWTQSNFLIMVKSKILPYKFTYLSMVKNIWTHSKDIEHGQKYLNMGKKYLN